ncbi:MAG: hypothetical protein HDR02_07595 [Lachnospiraceae bacterium]|nr:hypothetical protein [Lachnospiraceae bacterium]
MGLDIYAGTLTRYYAQNWKSMTQQWAEENGYTFSRITPGGAGENTASVEEIREAMENWRNQILQSITPQGKPLYAPWPENNEAPYYTDKPDWDAYGALVLYIACKSYGEPLPPTVKAGWDFQNHPVVQRMASDPDKHWSLFAGATWWLPIEDGFWFEGPLPTDDPAVIATTGGLKAELEKANELGWQAAEETILSWRDTEGYPPDITTKGLFGRPKIQKQTQYDTESLAKFAFSILWRAVKFSQENRVPILLDF